ncbi:Clavaminate synthase-like protein [Auriscalpium vulgare]|uniref:Clavaminate synthase-like protein n=1 Tax=Auriscalpium vulgare TaxID=40419 RepID=A0ACB8RCL3_9AGAM|nr:Clavaminate synthase-like protein [Auriscalpium vulgare]
MSTYPPFGLGVEFVSIVDLAIFDYKLVQDGDVHEIDKLWGAATGLGMWYLKNHGTEDEVEAMYGVAHDAFAIPQEEKDQYDHWKEGGWFGYHKLQAASYTETGPKLDLVEYFNISQNDILGFPDPIHRAYPPAVTAYTESVLQPFTHKSSEVNDTLLNVLNDRLGLPQGALRQRHRPHEKSGSQVRVTRTFPNPAVLPNRSLFNAHNDYGTLALLHSRIGGLQVFSHDWKHWNKQPIPNHAVCIIGDSLDNLTCGILHSALHAVVSPLGEQKAYERTSIVYLTRPEDFSSLDPMEGESTMIGEKVAMLKSAGGYANYGVTNGRTVEEFWRGMAAWRRMNAGCIAADERWRVEQPAH